MLLKRTFNLLLLFGVFALCRPAQSQQNPASPRINNQQIPGQEDDEARERITRDMAKKANIERQSALKSDTDKLVKLTAELKAYVDKSNENVLSLDVVRKAEEIEKLARSVKEKMKGPN